MVPLYKANVTLLNHTVQRFVTEALIHILLRVAALGNKAKFISAE